VAHNSVQLSLEVAEIWGERAPAFWVSIMERGYAVTDPQRNPSTDLGDVFVTRLLASSRFPNLSVCVFSTLFSDGQCMIELVAPVGNLTTSQCRSHMDVLLWFLSVVDQLMYLLGDDVQSVRWIEDYPHERGRWVGIDGRGFPVQASFPLFGWGSNRSLETCPEFFSYVDAVSEVSLTLGTPLAAHVYVEGKSYRFDTNLLTGEPLSSDEEVIRLVTLGDPLLRKWLNALESSRAPIAALKALFGPPDLLLPGFPANYRRGLEVVEERVEALWVYCNLVDGGALLFRILESGMVQMDFGKMVSDAVSA
jgi:hypothetical protein